MAVQLFCYLNFPGNTREALAYYQEVFGGEAAISTFGEYGIEGVPADGIMHAQLVTPAFTIMASDALAGAEREWAGSRIHLALMGDDLDLLTGWYERLAADGTPGQPLQAQVWGDTYGDVKDRFGIEWLFNISAA
ncbi:hypothetical protein PROP_02203 [Propionicimonas sp. T2.31MG-18]|uniref:VOC family protein n=1 Tax=Propionicimonas sp. T2.31MG-18 TaxID=3157620 RepID=UPI0035F015E8